MMKMLKTTTTMMITKTTMVMEVMKVMKMMTHWNLSKLYWKLFQLEEVPSFALKVRRRLAESEDKAGKQTFQSAVFSSPPLTGSYHVLLPIDSDDGIR